MAKVKGRLLFAKQVLGQDRPLHHVKVELWDVDPVINDFLASGVSRADGTFDIDYAEREAGLLDTPDLLLKVLDREFYYDGAIPRERFNLIATFYAGDNSGVGTHDFGDLRVGYWEYEDPADPTKVGFTPRVAVVHDDVPQGQRLGRTAVQVALIAALTPSYAATKAANALSENKPTNAEMMLLYPKNKTRKMEDKEAGSSLSDAYHVDQVLNGFYPCKFKKAAGNELVVDFEWGGLAQDGTHFAPDTIAYFKRENDTLTLERIEVRRRTNNEPAANAPLDPPQTYTPASPEWNQVKRLFRINYFLFGEVVSHLGGTHLNVEQYCVAAMRNLQVSPIARLLYPHFQGTVKINQGANGLLIKKEGLVPVTSALTEVSVATLVKSSFTHHNWYGWSPRDPVVSSHTYARAAQLYWRVLGDYLEDYFNTNDVEIRANWLEIQRLSDDLVNHALPFAKSDEARYLDHNEVNLASQPHPVVNGVPVAISPITTSAVPGVEDLANLLQFCRYVLFMATFQHTWVNDAQYDLGGDPLYATLGIARDISNPAIDEETAVRPSEALEHPFITKVLADTSYGYIIRNEDNDMNPALIEALRNARDEFRDLGVDVRNIRASINT